MKRKHNEMRENPNFEKRAKVKNVGFVSDPRLLGRVRQYMEDNRHKAMISTSVMADELQAKYGEYSRKKKIAFKKCVEKAYNVVCSEKKDRSTYTNLERKHLEKRSKEKQRDDSSDSSSDAMDDDTEKSFSSENEDYATYEDTNSMNSFMTDLYKKTPKTPGSQISSRPNSTPSSPLRSATSSVVDSASFNDPYRKKNLVMDSTSDKKAPRMPGSQPSSRPSSVASSPRRPEQGLEPGTAMFTIDRQGDPAFGSHPINKSSPLRNPNIRYQSDPKRGTGYLKETNNKAKFTKTSNKAIDESTKTKVTDTVSQEQIDSEKTSVIKEQGQKKVIKKKKKKSEEDADMEHKITTPDVQQSTVKFADIGGTEATLMEVCKLLVHMKHPEVYQALGVTPPRGFLLHGPPGCGKTLLAHAIAGELELPFLKLAATEIVSGVSGESEEKVRDLFDKALASSPCILFLDEIDAITQKRETASKDMERRIVSQLLTCMDDLNSKSGANVLVIGATNRPDSLDPALRRAGRFDREIALGIPDEAARLRILRVLCRDLRLTEQFDFGFLARQTPGFVGADLMALTREAAITAVSRVFNDLQSHSQVQATEQSSYQSAKEKSPLETPGTESQNQDTNRIQVETDSTLEKTDLIPNQETLEPGPLQEISNCDTQTTAVETISTESKDVSLLSEASNSTGAVSQSNNETESAVNIVSKQTSCENITDETDELMTKTTASGLSEDLAAGAEFRSVLSWLKDEPPLTEDQLASLSITMQDFEAALKVVQPSAKREGFATIPGVTWDDIGALKDVREELQMAILAPVRHPEEFKALGLSSPPGILLAGPPGCGKTMLAKAVANESGINFISVKGPELLNMYVGESERAVRQVFQRARNSSPCVIFFDELDALCPRRSHSGESGASVRVVNQLLTEMDGLEERKQVFIMAATNRPDIIDPAILRPGRLDKTLYVGLPTAEDIWDILKTITKNGTKPQLGEDVELKVLAENVRCQGFTGADLAALVREASVTALREFFNTGKQSPGSLRVLAKHFDIAFQKVNPSVSKQDQVIYKKLKDTIRSTSQPDKDL